MKSPYGLVTLVDIYCARAISPLPAREAMPAAALKRGDGFAAFEEIGCNAD